MSAHDDAISMRRMEALQSFVRACGGHESLLDGWTAKTETRQQGSSAGTTDTYFNPQPGEAASDDLKLAVVIKTHPLIEFVLFPFEAALI